jgi:regulatory protein
VALLARREHSRAELQRKLGGRGGDPKVVEAVLEGLAASGLQSDARFAESLVHSRVEGGCGPVRIRYELRQHAVDETLIQTCLESYRETWRALARTAAQKRFGEQTPADLKERARRARFLSHRGFTDEQIDAVLQGGDS